jgi:hypothetical protein
MEHTGDEGMVDSGDEQMAYTGDELAAIVDLFGGLSPPELIEAVQELAYRRGEEPAEDEIYAAIEAATREYQLLRLRRYGAVRLVPGPTAFPELPEGAEDLPHMLDVERRSIAADAVADRARERLASDAEEAVETADSATARRLLDVSYDVESLGAGDVADIRDRLEPVAEGA